MQILLLGLLMPFFSVSYGADSNLCQADPNKGACINFEKPGRLQVPELPKDLTYSTFLKMRIPGTLRNKKMTGADLQEAQLFSGMATDSIFQQSNMKGFRGKGTNFSRSVFDGADLRGAKFYRAKFINSSFKKADFREADLSFCDFTGADLRGADLTGSFILGGKFTGAKIDSQTQLPFAVSTALQHGMILTE